ncbi:threonine aldolase family protein [Portibacter marinus]|uniref:threonine aldolase family protein n=1 Tax=Portibacter marinus TaxID=2898660 RepID=UPI001F44983F|nr:GntG family PLP-dependent aldolase [Portibacter marinus]
MDKVINLMSDTVTKPGTAMLKAMMSAEVGDDVFRQDPTINRLEKLAADLFEKEGALFCPSGTMTNQIAIKVHTQPLDEVICDELSHIYQYETGGYAFNSGVAINLIKGNNGKITADQIEAAIKDDYDWLPKSSLVVLENSCNKGGGSYYTLEEIATISALCKERGLKLHLDGARLFNVLVETGESTAEVGRYFDSLSICLSKGLGAPVGSLLIGDTDFISQARRFRKVMGGGMRQAGILAAAGIYALENNVERLKIDNDRAKEIAEILGQCNFVDDIRPVKTNILIFDIKSKYDVQELLKKLKENDILAVQFGPQTIRFVFHLDITKEMMDRLKTVLSQLSLPSRDFNSSRISAARS